MTIASAAPVGVLIRDWRTHRRLSQMELALEAGISPRHLSFVETGRSQPGRGTLLSLAEVLEVPLRDRNRLLLAAGLAPAYAERSLDDSALEPARQAGFGYRFIRKALHPGSRTCRNGGLTCLHGCGAKRP